MQSSATLESSSAAPAASLRLRLPGETAEQRRPLHPLPLIVGRSEGAHLRIVSNRVSREHAAFEWRDGQFWVRDLGSTNGTFLGSRRIERGPLSHGSTIHIADIAVTLELDEPPAGACQGMLQQLRVWQQRLLRHGGPARYVPVWDLSALEVVACLAATEPAAGEAGGLPASRAARQLQWLGLLRAVQQSRELSQSLPLHLPLQYEDDAACWLSRLAAEAGGRPLVLRLPPGGGRRLLRRIRAAGLQAAAEIGLGEPLPEDVDQCWLSPRQMQEIAADESQWPRLGEICERAAAAGVAVVANGLADEDAARICAEVGCRWASGPALGGPQTAAGFAEGLTTG